MDVILLIVHRAGCEQGELRSVVMYPRGLVGLMLMPPLYVLFDGIVLFSGTK